MANIIELPSGPKPVDYINHFVSNYLQSQAANDEADRQQQQMELGRQQMQQTKDYQSGMLQHQNDVLEDARKKYAAEQFLDQTVKPLHEAGDVQGATKAVNDFLTQNPDMRPYLIGAAQGRATTPLDTANANTAAFSANQTGRAAGGSTDPNAVNFATHKAIGTFMPKEGFEQQQAMDLANQQNGPNLTKAIPSPGSNPVANFESRVTGAMTTAPQNQTSQTNITTEGMRQAGENKRTAMTVQGQKDIAGMRIAADSSAPQGSLQDRINNTISAVLADPTGQAFFALPHNTDEDKQVLSAVQAAIVKQHGRMPQKGNGTESAQIESANSITPLMQTMEAIRQKWKDRGVDIIAPVSGSFDSFSNSHLGGMGVGMSVPDKYRAEFQRDTQIINGLANMASVQEARAISGRYNEQLGKRLLAQYPNTGETEGKFQGGMTEATLRGNNIRNSILEKLWGGRIPSTVNPNASISQDAQDLIHQVVANDPDTARRLGLIPSKGGAPTGYSPANDPAGLFTGNK